MSDEYRFGDETPPAERSQRLYQEEPDGAWYFRTREGAPVGPFESAAEAQQALVDFIEFIRLADLQTLSELTRSLAAEADAAAGVDSASDAAAGVDRASDAAKPAPLDLADAVSAEPASAEPATNGVGAWEPNAQGVQPSTAVLADLQRRFIANGEATARGLLTPPLLPAVDSAGLIALIRFFTLAEQELPGWEAGSKSPAIACARELRLRGRYPADLTAWIRDHTDNRFLPYGSLLDRI